MYWKINRIQFPVYNIGPGKRLAIWVQGCSLACKGCINPELWTENGGKNIEIASLASSILKIKNHFDGITITGGEPFEQYNALVAFGRFIKMKSNLNILVYSGFTLDELTQKFPDKLFMNSLDYLIDGRFEKDFACCDNIRGSSNQNFYTFEGGKSVKDNNQFFNGKWSLNVTKANQVFMAGVPKKDDMSSLIGYLKDSGIKLDL
jgi:anaerobic ribonucleoside-triphosphate reductase activating protein